MKFLPFCLLATIFSYSQTIDNILFDYDSAGNQIKRYAVDLVTGRPAQDSIKNIEDVTEADFLPSDLYIDVSYYPNPVKDELYVKWTNQENAYVNEIAIFSINGQLLKAIDIQKKQNTLNVSFFSYPEGLYTLLLNYSDGKKRTLKIIK